MNFKCFLSKYLFECECKTSNFNVRGRLYFKSFKSNEFVFFKIQFDDNAELRQRYKYGGNMVLKLLCKFIHTERLDVQNPGLNAYSRIVQSQKATISKSAELDVEACQVFWMPNFEKEIWLMKTVAKVEKRWHSRMICMTNRVGDTNCGQICNGRGKGLS